MRRWPGTRRMTVAQGARRSSRVRSIQFCLSIKVLFKLPLRQSEPARRHRFEPAGERDGRQPPAARRAGLARSGLLHAVSEAENLEGADSLSPGRRPAEPAGGQHRHQGPRRWRVASPKHGVQGRRPWRKVHLAMDTPPPTSAPSSSPPAGTATAPSCRTWSRGFPTAFRPRPCASAWSGRVLSSQPLTQPSHPGGAVTARAMAQMKPTISRAMAVVTTTFAFPAASRWRYR
jgi:hypothetical protein